MKRVSLFLACLLVFLQLFSACAAADSNPYGNWLRTTGSVNVRSGPGLSYSSLGTLSKGVYASYRGQYSYDARGVCWYLIDFEGAFGWISSKYSTLESAAPKPVPVPTGKPNPGAYYSYLYTTGNVNIRTGPNLGNKSLGTAPKGVYVQHWGESAVDSRGVTWYHVYYNGIDGWASSKYVKIAY